MLKSLTMKDNLDRLGDMTMRGVGLILPARCPVTGEIVDRQGMISPAAWQALTFVTDPLCSCCGLRLPHDSDSDDVVLCAVCLAERPVFHQARSAVLYDDHSRPLILGFKHADQTHLVRIFTPWLKLAGQKILDDADVIVPVPLHWTRLLKRRYNQSAILAKALARESGKIYGADVLKRIRATPPQGTLSRKERLQNVRKAFSLHGKRAGFVRDKKIILIDDVYTTGATIEECAGVLYAAGAQRVDVLTLARVERPESL